MVISISRKVVPMKNFQSGRLVQQAHYKSFQPNHINRAWSLDDMSLLRLLGQADREPGRLDMYSECIPNHRCERGEKRGVKVSILRGSSSKLNISDYDI